MRSRETAPDGSYIAKRPLEEGIGLDSGMPKIPG